MCETKTKNEDFYFQIVSVEKPYAEPDGCGLRWCELCREEINYDRRYYLCGSECQCLVPAKENLRIPSYRIETLMYSNEEI